MKAINDRSIEVAERKALSMINDAIKVARRYVDVGKMSDDQLRDFANTIAMFTVDAATKDPAVSRMALPSVRQQVEIEIGL